MTSDDVSEGNDDAVERRTWSMLSQMMAGNKVELGPRLGSGIRVRRRRLKVRVLFIAINIAIGVALLSVGLEYQTSERTGSA